MEKIIVESLFGDQKIIYVVRNCYPPASRRGTQFTVAVLQAASLALGRAPAPEELLSLRGSPDSQHLC